MKKYLLYFLNIIVFITTPYISSTNHDANLLQACRQNASVKIISAILAHGADVNYCMADNYTALHYACMHNNEMTAKLLLKQKNIAINKQNKLGNTPLLIASSKNNITIVKLLLEHPLIKSSLQNNQGNTALHIAAYFDYEEIVKILTDHHEYHPMLQNNRSKTAYDMAHEGQSRAIELLKTNSQ